ncbi:hypothetical protein P3W85_05865 [Cupriavidus basilensis]|uniref:Uncharacterized protein n=1 Tax=Cupriavidus basilensis TaxID=68895 RepID=A0ABT6AIP5_9BURK|nr:hypothetical protein [Cupriavidus basilensis]MDF3832471.1 hypothetical protein [Cupriavidus basilensis]
MLVRYTLLGCVENVVGWSFYESVSLFIYGRVVIGDISCSMRADARTSRVRRRGQRLRGAAHALQIRALRAARGNARGRVIGLVGQSNQILSAWIMPGSSAPFTRP